MPRPQRDKDFTIFSSPDPVVKKKTTQQAAARVRGVAKQDVANTLELLQADQVTMEQIFAEIKSVAFCVNDMNDSVSARLDTIDFALNIKVSVASVESSLLALSNRVTEVEKRMDEVE
ncbi:hypothetical protein PAMP_023880 [Pampus punctatissimus]